MNKNFLLLIFLLIGFAKVTAFTISPDNCPFWNITAKDIKIRYALAEIDSSGDLVAEFHGFDATIHAGKVELISPTEELLMDKLEHSNTGLNYDHENTFKILITSVSTDDGKALSNLFIRDLNAMITNSSPVVLAFDPAYRGSGLKVHSACSEKHDNDRQFEEALAARACRDFMHRQESIRETSDNSQDF